MAVESRGERKASQKTADVPIGISNEQEMASFSAVEYLQNRVCVRRFRMHDQIVKNKLASVIPWVITLANSKCLSMSN